MIFHHLGRAVRRLNQNDGVRAKIVAHVVNRQRVVFNNFEVIPDADPESSDDEDNYDDPMDI